MTYRKLLAPLIFLATTLFSSQSYAGQKFWCDSSVNGISLDMAGSFHVYAGNSEGEYFALIFSDIFAPNTAMLLDGVRLDEKIVLNGKEYGDIENCDYRGQVQIFLDHPSYDFENKLYYSGRFTAEVLKGGAPGLPGRYQNLNYRCYPVVE